MKTTTVTALLLLIVCGYAVTQTGWSTAHLRHRARVVLQQSLQWLGEDDYVVVDCDCKARQHTEGSSSACTAGANVGTTETETAAAAAAATTPTPTPTPTAEVHERDPQEHALLKALQLTMLSQQAVVAYLFVELGVADALIDSRSCAGCAEIADLVAQQLAAINNNNNNKSSSSSNNNMRDEGGASSSAENSKLQQGHLATTFREQLSKDGFICRLLHASVQLDLLKGKNGSSSEDGQFCLTDTGFALGATLTAVASDHTSDHSSEGGKLLKSMQSWARFQGAFAMHDWLWKGALRQLPLLLGEKGGGGGGGGEGDGEEKSEKEKGNGKREEVVEGEAEQQQQQQQQQQQMGFYAALSSSPRHSALFQVGGMICHCSFCVWCSGFGLFSILSLPSQF